MNCVYVMSAFAPPTPEPLPQQIIKTLYFTDANAFVEKKRSFLEGTEDFKGFGANRRRNRDNEL